MNKVTVKINGVEYNLKGEEDEEYLHKLAAYVDKKLKFIMDSNKKLSTSSAAVLTAVNTVDDLFKCDSAYKELLIKIDEMEENERKLKNQLEDLKAQVLKFEVHNKELIEQVSNKETEKVIQEKDIEISALREELAEVKEVSENYFGHFNTFKVENKDLRFQLQEARKKVMDLQNKLEENQISLVKAKKMNNPLIKK